MRKFIKIIFCIIIILIICLFINKIKQPILEKIYPMEYSDYVQKYSEEYEVDKYLIFAIIKAESNFEEDAVSTKDAKGLMQIMDSTAEDISEMIGFNSDIDILDPEININFGTKYISTLIKKYGCIELALAAYNAGSGNVDTWIEDGTLEKDGSNIENIPYKETNNYVRKILRDYEIYKNLYTDEIM